MDRNHLHQTAQQAHELSNKATLMQKLDEHYRMVSTIILSKQHPSTGLLPASTAVTTHGDYRDAWVRDNVYSILAVFGLALAYRRCDDDQGRTYELEHSVVKLMRGLLFSMMLQSRKVELFKNNQSVDNALHAKYSTVTGGTVVGDRSWGHLQLDATSIFVLALAEMTSAGLKIVFTLDEVDFVQNLVFYIERAYRTPDYGIWERGNKINHGQPELNSSSIGMAVAALQAINGVNLFGSRGGAASVIHVLPDEITRNHTTLHSALPRESNSKEIDAALFSIIGYPAFAVHDSALLERTRAEIIQKLKGNYGCKRFLRDGHQAVLEDTTRLHYESHELQVFEHIECEWPLFFTYIILEGLFRGDSEQVEKYRKALEPCLIDSRFAPAMSHAPPPIITRTSDKTALGSASSTNTDTTLATPTPTVYQPLPAGMPLLPELFIVPKALVKAEKEKPHSQKRTPNDNLPLVWAQSLYILGELLYQGLLSPAEIDPLGRYLLPDSRGKKKKDTVVQVVLIAEDSLLQSRLATFGLETQTLQQVAPVTVSSPAFLRDAYSALGANPKLGFTGRPKRPVGTLATCKLYKVQGRLYAFTPHFMDQEEFYMTTDNDYLVSIFEHELLFVRNHWWYTGRPTMVVCLTHNMMGSLTGSSGYGIPESFPPSSMQSPLTGKSFAMPSKQRKSILGFIMSLRSGMCAGVRVRLARLQEVIPTSCVESLDFLTRKIDQGFIKQTGHLTWQGLLGEMNFGRRDSGRWHLAKSAVEETARVNVHSTSAKDDLSSSYLSPRDSGFASKPPASKLVIDNGDRRDSEFKLKAHGVSDNAYFRPSSPLLFSKKVSSLDSPRDSFSRATEVGKKLEHAFECLSITLGDAQYVNLAIDYLNSSTNIHDQVDLLHYLESCKGLDFVIQLTGANNNNTTTATVKELLEEVYAKASQARMWSTVRHVAGVLRKVVNSLTINLTDLLIRQKQVTIGMGESETPVLAPVAPAILAEIIFTECPGDPREAPLIQEIMIYLGSFVRSEQNLFDGILRVRVHYIILAMREEVSRMLGCNEEFAMEHIMKMSPSEVKSLLGFILSARKTIETQEKSHEEGDVISNIEISAQSGGYYDGSFATISIKGQRVITRGDRGMNVIVLNHEDGIVLECTQFDTHISKEESDDFAKLIENYESGVMFVIAAKDDAFENLTEAARVACEAIGSKLIRKCGIRDSWCIIGRKHQKDFEAIESWSVARSKPSDVINYVITYGCTKNDPADVGSAQFLPNKGLWLRRRKIDGALQRSPIGFYPHVHRILQKSATGLKINNSLLPRDPTVSEKTPEEVNFALQVEWLLNAVEDPAERQIAVECLVVISEMERRNPEIQLGGSNVIDITKIIRGAYEIFWNQWFVEEGYKRLHKFEVVPEKVDTGKATKPKEGPSGQDLIHLYPFSDNISLAHRLFFDLKQDGVNGTMSFLAKAALRVLPFQLSVNIKHSQDGDTNNCSTM